MILHLLEQRGYRRFLLYALPISLYILTSFLLNRLMIPDIDLWSVLGFEVFFLLVCYGFSCVLDLLFSPKYWLWGGIVLVVFAFTMSVGAYYYIYELMPRLEMQITKADADFNTREFLQNCILGLFRAFTYGLIYFVLKRLKREAKGRILELEARLALERLLAMEEAEKNAYKTANLTAQIFPHFMQNAFAMMAGMAAERGDLVLMDTVLSLSGMMGYLSERAKSFDQLVYLQDELKQMDRLLDTICRQRGGTEVVQKVQHGVPRPLAIPPLVLLTLIDNALKYGVIGKSSPLLLGIHFGEESFVFSCENKKKLALTGVESTRIGLQNIFHRLTLLLPGRFDLQVTDEDTWFRVTLSIAYR